MSKSIESGESVPPQEWEALPLPDRINSICETVYDAAQKWQTPIDQFPSGSLPEHISPEHLVAALELNQVREKYLAARHRNDLVYKLQGDGEFLPESFDPVESRRKVEEYSQLLKGWRYHEGKLSKFETDEADFMSIQYDPGKRVDLLGENPGSPDESISYTVAVLTTSSTLVRLQLNTEGNDVMTVRRTQTKEQMIPGAGTGVTHQAEIAYPRRGRLPTVSVKIEPL